MYEKCIWCEKDIPESGEPFCNGDHKQLWARQQHEENLELEREKAERLEDPNAGCWSQSW